MADDDRLFDIAIKSAIVTGASSGLGLAFAGMQAERSTHAALVDDYSVWTDDFAQSNVSSLGNILWRRD